MIKKINLQKNNINFMNLSQYLKKNIFIIGYQLLIMGFLFKLKVNFILFENCLHKPIKQEILQIVMVRPKNLNNLIFK